MASRLTRALSALDLEEQILNGAAIIAIISLFFPWFSGEWLGGEQVSFSGFQFYTSIIGITISVLYLLLLAITIVPIVGGPILVKRRHRESIRMFISLQASILVIAILSVLTRTTFDFNRMDVRFGTYVCLIASLVVLFEAAARFSAQRRLQNDDEEVFHHPEEGGYRLLERKDSIVPPPPPPPPPPPLEPEDHPFHS